MAYWLIPAEPALGEFRRIVADLAKRFGGPCFVPHVTLYVGPYDPRDVVDDITRSFISISHPELRVRNLSFTEKFTQSCFVQFEENETVLDMSESIQRSVRNPVRYQMNPHMSLFYGALSLEERDEIRGTIALAEQVSFDVVAAISNPPQVASRQDVESWREIARAPLAAAR